MALIDWLERIATRFREAADRRARERRHRRREERVHRAYPLVYPPPPDDSPPAEPDPSAPEKFERK